MHALCTILVVCWFAATTLLALTAHASKMSFLAWFLIGTFLPVILLALLAECGRKRLHALIIFDHTLVESKV